MKAFLVIVILSSGHGSFKSSTEMLNMEKCLEVLAAVQLVVPNGNENESSAVAFCSYEDHDGFLGRWH